VASIERAGACKLCCSSIGCPSERIWSLRDQLSGGDPFRANPETLTTQLMLKKNVPVRALIEQRSLFDVLDANK
jgi:hypothetical protein